MKLQLPKTNIKVEKSEVIDQIMDMVKIGVNTKGAGLTGLSISESLAMLHAIKLTSDLLGLEESVHAVMNVVYAMGYTRGKEEAIETARSVDPITVLDNVDANLKRLIG